jgi:RNA polymerase sigma-70 factor (ECF subfamily)
MNPAEVLTEQGIVDLYERHAPNLFQYCARRVGPDTAEDIVGATFLIAFEQRRRFDPDRAPAPAWLYGIATNLLRRHRRDEVRAYRALARTGVDPLLDSHAQRADERADARAVTRRIAGLLAALPHRHRDVLLLNAIGEMEPIQIAAALRMPVGTVRSILHRTRAKLRAGLAANGDAS